MYYCRELACDKWELILMATILPWSAHAIFGDDDDDNDINNVYVTYTMLETWC